MLKQILPSQDTNSRHIFLLLPALLFVCLFPYGWLAEQSPLFNQIASFLFGTEIAHIIGHTIMYGGVTAVLLTAIPKLMQRSALYITAIVIVGVLQEALQIFSYKMRPIVFNDVFDVMVNTLAATAVLLIMRHRSQNSTIIG